MIEAADRFQLENLREIAFQFIRQEINENNIWDIWECAGKNREKRVKSCVIQLYL
jgi:hypothetical protein